MRNIVNYIKIKHKDIAKTLDDVLVDRRFKIEKDATYAYIPVKEAPKGYVIIEKDIPLQKNFKSEVMKILSLNEQKEVVTAYDTIGSIAILEIPEILQKKEHQIASLLLECKKSIKTVVKKASIHQGEFRIQNYTYLAGEETFETTHKENNTFITLNINTVYYSPRSASERKRILQQVTSKENILVMFSGCAPFVCVIGKNAKPKSIVGIELNKEGHMYGLRNIQKNKLSCASLINGDVILECSRLTASFDRIIMPLPKSAELFLDAAFSVAKKGTIIHLYSFSHEKDFPKKTISLIDAACKRHGITYTVLSTVLCGNYSPRVHRVCVDFKVLDIPRD